MFTRHICFVAMSPPYWLSTYMGFGASLEVSIYFPFDGVGGIWNLMVSVPDHLPFTFTIQVLQICLMCYYDENKYCNMSEQNCDR